LGLRASRPDPRPVGYYLNDRIADGEPSIDQQPMNMLKYPSTRHPAPFRPIYAEHTAQVTETGRGEQSIAQGVHGNVTVRVTGAAVGVIKQEP
jgi:hypothetical protein